jgi:hypothetical protein
VAGDVKPVRINIDRNDMARDLGNLQREPAVA